MPVPGSRVIGFRPRLGHEARLVRAQPERVAVDDKWSPMARVLFVVAAGSSLWLAMGFAIQAII